MSSILSLASDNQANPQMTFAPGSIIPQSFWLGGIKFSVVWGLIHMDSGRAVSHAEYSSQIIVLDPTMTPLQMLEQAYIQQLIDLILIVSGDKELRNKTPLMTSCSHFLYQAMKSFEKRPLSDLTNYVGNDSSSEMENDLSEATNSSILAVPSSTKESIPTKITASIAEFDRDTTIIPKAVEVGGLVFPVHIQKIHADKGVLALGKIDYEQQQILIDPTLASLQVTEQSFFHELMHLLFFVCGESDLRVNERLVEVMGQFLYQAIMTAVPRPQSDREDAIKQILSKTESRADSPKKIDQDSEAHEEPVF